LKDYPRKSVDYEQKVVIIIFNHISKKMIVGQIKQWSKTGVTRSSITFSMHQYEKKMGYFGVTGEARKP
jgi:hypothetical protein